MEMVRKVFKTFDESGDGDLGVTEFRKFLDALVTTLCTMQSGGEGRRLRARGSFTTANHIPKPFLFAHEYAHTRACAGNLTLY